MGIEIESPRQPCEIPESEHVASDVGVVVVEVISTHSSPDAAELHLQTSCSLSSVSTDESNFFYSYTSTHRHFWGKPNSQRKGVGVIEKPEVIDRKSVFGFYLPGVLSASSALYLIFTEPRVPLPRLMKLLFSLYQSINLYLSQAKAHTHTHTHTPMHKTQPQCTIKETKTKL